MIYVFSDGSIKGGNPGGHCGAGVLIAQGPEQWPGTEHLPRRPWPLRKFSVYLGQGTNNIAELAAILVGLRSIRQLHPYGGIVVVSDSQYSIGVIRGGQVRKNRELIVACRAEVRRLDRVRFQWVKGHAGLPGNEAADELACQAATDRKSWAVRCTLGGEEPIAARVPQECKGWLNS